MLPSSSGFPPQQLPLATVTVWALLTREGKAPLIFCPTSWTCSNSRPSSQGCHPTISSSVAPFSSCLHSFPSIRVFSHQVARVWEPQHQPTLDSASGTFPLEPGPAPPRGGGLAVLYLWYPGCTFPRDTAGEGQTKTEMVVRGMEGEVYVVRSLR